MPRARVDTPSAITAASQPPKPGVRSFFSFRFSAFTFKSCSRFAIFAFSLASLLALVASAFAMRACFFSSARCSLVLLLAASLRASLFSLRSSRLSFNAAARSSAFCLCSSFFSSLFCSFSALSFADASLRSSRGSSFICSDFFSCISVLCCTAALFFAPLFLAPPVFRLAFPASFSAFSAPLEIFFSLIALLLYRKDVSAYRGDRLP